MKRLLFLSIFLQSCHLSGQDYPRQEINFQQVADELGGFQDGESDHERIQENLMQYLAHPLDLNAATAEELKSLHILNETQIQSLIQHRASSGEFISVYELQAVPEFDLSDIYRLIPFVTVADPNSSINASLLKRIRHAGDNYVLFRYSQALQKKAGFLSPGEHAFRGSPSKVYIRCRTSKPGDFSFGVTLEKDEGESIEWNPSAGMHGFDYISFHGQLMNKNRIQNLIIGDFQGQFGQGLTLGAAQGLGKGGETITGIRRSNIGFVPFTSAYEAGGLRGIALTLKLQGHFRIHTFASSNLRDGNFDQGDSVITALQTTGLHRTQAELANRKTIREQNAGIVIQYQRGALDAGLICHLNKYAHEILKTPSPYNQFAFGGTSNVNAGFYLNYAVQNFSFFSEAAKSVSGGTGLIAGVLGSLSPKFDLSLVVRSYDRNFYTVYGSSLSENTQPQNERGMYWGWKHKFNRRFSIAGYMDLFRFPWLRFRNYRPSYGSEWLLRFDYQPSRKILLTMQMRTETKERNASAESPSYFVQSGRKQNFLINTQYGIGQTLRLRTRVQYSEYQLAAKITSGICLIQDLFVERGRLKCNLRYALFDTEDYDNRQYAYENDVWLAYSLPAYDGRGVRKVVVVQYKLTKAISFWLRLARTRYTDRSSSGSGPDLVMGNIRDEIRFQAMFRF